MAEWIDLSASAAVDSGWIQLGEIDDLKLIFIASLLDVWHKRINRQVYCLCCGKRHLTGFPI